MVTVMMRLDEIKRLTAGASVSSAEINRPDPGGWTLLQWACKQGWSKEVKLLLAKGADPNVKGPMNYMAIMWAVHIDDGVTCELLIDAGADVDAATVTGHTPLILAAKQGSRHCLALLIGKGAKVDARSGDGATALHLAALHGFADIASTLIKAGAEVNATTTDGVTPLLSAVSFDKSDVVSVLLDANADVECRKEAGGSTPLITAATSSVDDPRIVELLLSAGAGLEARTHEGATAVMAAASKNNTNILKALLTKGCEVNNQSETGLTALHSAASQGHKEAVELLLRHGATPNTRTNAKHKTRSTPLIDACRHRHTHVARRLLENGASPDVGDEDGATALIMAAGNPGSDEIVELLIKHGADVNAEVTRLGYMALMGAAVKGRVHVLKRLMDNGADLEKRNWNGATALMLAAMEGPAEAVKVLVSDGADPLSVDKHGVNALQYGKDQPEIRMALQKAASRSVLKGKDTKKSDARTGGAAGRAAAAPSARTPGIMGPGAVYTRCSNCGADATPSLKMKQCSKCYSAAYCSRDCQVEHWTKKGHKLKCKSLAELAFKMLDVKDALGNKLILAVMQQGVMEWSSAENSLMDRALPLLRTIIRPFRDSDDVDTYAMVLASRAASLIDMAATTDDDNMRAAANKRLEALLTEMTAFADELSPMCFPTSWVLLLVRYTMQLHAPVYIYI